MFFKTVTCIITAAVAYYWKYYINTGPIYTTEKNLSGKTVLITGDNLVYFVRVHQNTNGTSLEIKFQKLM